MAVAASQSAVVAESLGAFEPAPPNSTSPRRLLPLPAAINTLTLPVTLPQCSCNSRPPSPLRRARSAEDILNEDEAEGDSTDDDETGSLGYSRRPGTFRSQSDLLATQFFSSSDSIPQPCPRHPAGPIRSHEPPPSTKKGGKKPAARRVGGKGGAANRSYNSGGGVGAGEVSELRKSLSEKSFRRALQMMMLEEERKGEEERQRRAEERDRAKRAQIEALERAAKAVIVVAVSGNEEFDSVDLLDGTTEADLKPREDAAEIKDTAAMEMDNGIDYAQGEEHEITDDTAPIVFTVRPTATSAIETAYAPERVPVPEEVLRVDDVDVDIAIVSETEGSTLRPLPPLPAPETSALQPVSVGAVTSLLDDSFNVVEKPESKETPNGQASAAAIASAYPSRQLEVEPEEQMSAAAVRDNAIMAPPIPVTVEQVPISRTPAPISQRHLREREESESRCLHSVLPRRRRRTNASTTTPSTFAAAGESGGRASRSSFDKVRTWLATVFRKGARKS